MSVAYDEYYKQLDYFGKPYPKLIEYFEELSKDKHVLDLGCGQGRDSIALGIMGYKVTGVDISIVGINQLNKLAKSLDINVNGVVSDLYSFPIIEEYSIILLDSILHFYKKDIEKESNLVNRILCEMRVGAVLCIFMQKGKQREKILNTIITNSVNELKISTSKYIDYPDFNADYFMITISKIA